MKLLHGKRSFYENRNVIGFNRGSLGTYEYKRLLDIYYKPDDYLLFHNSGDYIPLVVKEDMVTFFGGTQHNHQNTLPSNQVLINKTLEHLRGEGYRFRLLSILNDYYGYLFQNNIGYDVPYPPTWIYRAVDCFDVVTFLNKFTGKEKWSLKRVLKWKEKYSFKSIEYADFDRIYDEIFSLHVKYFQDRGLVSVWCENKELLHAILEYFNEKHNLTIRLATEKDKPIGIYVIVHSVEDLVFYFGGSLDKNNHYVSKAIYLDMLETTKTLARKNDITELNALRGTYENKRRFDFEPQPLYALVNDTSWVIDKEHSLDSALSSNGVTRPYGVFQNGK